MGEKEFNACFKAPAGRTIYWDVAKHL